MSKPLNESNFNKTYRYIGPSPGGGETHRIIYADPDTDEIITISPTHAWLGDSRTFQKHFKENTKPSP